MTDDLRREQLVTAVDALYDGGPPLEEILAAGTRRKRRVRVATALAAAAVAGALAVAGPRLWPAGSAGDHAAAPGGGSTVAPADQPEPAATSSGSPDPTQAASPSPPSGQVDLAGYGTDLLAAVGATDITTGELPTVYSASMLADLGGGSVQLDAFPDLIRGDREVTGTVRLAPGAVGEVLDDRSIGFRCEDAYLVLTYYARADAYSSADLGGARNVARRIVGDAVCRGGS